MTATANKAQTDVLRILAYTGISSSYAAVGTPLTYATRMIRIINNTDADMYFSDDGATNKWYVPASSFVLYDYFTNYLCYSANVQIYVKNVTALTKGQVAIESTYSFGEGMVAISPYETEV
jgi:hypothetical protein